MILTNSLNNQISYTGIYKIKGFKSKKNFDIKNFLSENIYVHRISEPFKDEDSVCIYAVTSDDITAEAFFEHQLKKNSLSYLKTLPFEQIVNRNIIDMLFEISKKLKGKEIWKS